VKNPEANNLHKKMLFVSNKLKTAEQGKNLFGGIKLDQARHELFQGQNSDAYFTEKWRPAAYHHLIMAEKELEKLRRAGKAYVELTLTDFDKDGEDEILLTNDFLSLYFSPRLGGSIFEIDYKPRAVNLCHSRLSLLDHFLAPGTTMAEFSDSGFGEAGDFVQGRYNFMPARKEGAVGLRLSRNGEVQGAPVKIEKNITLHAKHSIFLVEYEITNLWEEPDEFLFGVEFNIDDTKNFAVSLEADKSAVLWCQQNVIMPNWRFKLKPQESWHGKISVRIEE
jgi:alpha-amylase